MTDTQPDGTSRWVRIQTILWIVPLLVAILLPGLVWMVAERPMAARIQLAAAMSVIAAVVALILLAVFSKGFRRDIRRSLGLTSITVLVLFQWPLLTTAGLLIADAVPIPLLGDLFPVIAAIGFLWVATRIGDEIGFAAITSIGMLIVAVALVVGALPFVPGSRGVAEAQPPDPASPDVLLIILDGYTRADVLDSQFGFDNSPFLTDLEGLGFVIAEKAQSNYSFTYASVASMFELDYVYDAGAIAPDEEEAMRNALAGDPAIMRLFREQGYEVAYVENAWQGSVCGPGTDICIRDGIFERASWNLTQVTIFAPLVKTIRPHPFNTVSFGHLEALPEIASRDRTDGVPRLTIAHILLPHPPFLLDAECEQVNTSARRAFTTPSVELIENRRWFYTDQMMCTNAVLVESLEEILSNNSNTIVMITGDHGSGSTRLANKPVEEWNSAALEERIGILSAYRMPHCEDLIYPSITPVNGVRQITSCALGTSLGSVPDLSMWSPSDGKGEVTDLTDLLP